MMTKFKNLFLSIICLLVIGTTFCTTEQPVKWNYTVNYLSPSEAELVFNASIAANWHLYSQYQNGIALPLVFNITPNANYQILSESKYLIENPQYTEVYNDEFKDRERFFSKYAQFKQKIRILNSQNFEIKGRIEGQACIDEKCIPVMEEFVFNIKAITKKLQPKSTTIQKNSKEKEVITTHQTPEKDTVATPLTSSIDTIENQHQDIANVNKPIPETQENESLWLFFIIAFGSGLLGILTPCVFPMIPMTVSFFIKQKNGKKQALFYGISIILIYVIIGILLALIFGEGFANFISTHWLPNLLFAAIFILFAISLLGYFEIALPSRLINKSAKNETRAGYIGTFFMALTLVLVSFSCTLPIAGAVALNAINGNFLKPIIGMLGFSLAFAIPFTFLAFFPDLLKKMPKSGGWMNTLKVTLAFIELAFALKFINVPDQTYLWGILDREVYLAVWIVLFTMLGFYFLGKIRFPYDDDNEKIQTSWIRVFLAIATFSFVVYMIPGMFGAPLKAISGWLPPMETQDFKIQQSFDHNTINKKTVNLCEIPLFSNELHTPTGLSGYFDYDQAIQCAQIQNKPILLDFTGHGCVNCRKVEQTVFADVEIQNLINEAFIFCELYVDNKVLKLPEAYQIKDKKGEYIQSLGRKNMYIQNSIYQENSQPCYFIISPEGVILNGPLFFETDIKTYKTFLEKGLQKYESL